MAVIGTFTHADQATDPTRPPDTVDWYGSVLELRAFIPAAPLLRFAALITKPGGALFADVTTLAALLRFTADVLTAESHKALIDSLDTDDRIDLDDLSGLCSVLYVAAAGRPTQRPSDSTGGPPTTGGNSNTPSSDPWQGLTPVDSLDEATVTGLVGSPDGG